MITNFISQRQRHRIGYYESDLRSLGIDPARMNDLNDEVELQSLAANLKDSMYQDYKTAYSLKGDLFEEEARSTTALFGSTIRQNHRQHLEQMM